MVKKKITFVLPSLVMGGLERVGSELSNYFSEKKNCTVQILLLNDKDIFYCLHKEIIIQIPSKKIVNSRYKSILLVKYIRDKILSFHPDVILSFGSMFNTFVLVSTLGLKIPVYVSDRSNPYRNSSFKIFKNYEVKHDGIMHILLKWFFYKKAHGIIAQTNLSKKVDENFLGHKNIKVIGNPIRSFDLSINKPRENIILNVGRFTVNKNQIFLIRLFSKIKQDNWKLYFAGDGPNLVECKNEVIKLGLEGNVCFLGRVSNIDSIYMKAKIFAFCSLSEGFPNVLGEAMRAGLACISFDCVSGPSDLIEDNKSGFLVQLSDEKEYFNKLNHLIRNEDLRKKFSEEGLKKILEFNSEKICDEYFNFIFN